MNLFVIARADSFGNAHERAAVHITVLGLVTNAEHADPAAEVVKLPLAALVERRLNRPALALAQLASPADR
jgi:hypothetical protein